MEDEECLPENSSLKVYLQNLGFSDLQVTKNAPQNPSSFRFEVPKPNLKHPCVDTIDESVIDQINVIVSSQMLFEEDVLNIEKLLSNFNVVKNGMVKSMFKDEFGLAVIFLGLSLYWLIGHYAFFIVSSFYAYRAAYYLQRNHFHRTRLKKLTSILQANFTLLRKTVKFIEENSLVEDSCKSKNVSTEFMEGFNFYKNFKSDFLIMINEMINMMVNSTQKLIRNIPLYDHIENPEYYLCNNLNQNYEHVNFSKMYEIYLLVQSEFLQRLILSLIPNINLSKNNSFNELNKILTETCISSLKIKNKLNKQFKFIFLNGIHSVKTELKLPLKNKTSPNSYVEELMLNIHGMSKIFQNLLLKSRIIEENLMSDKISVFVEQDLVKMQSDLYFCQKNINDSIILLSRVNAVSKDPNKCDEVKIQEEKIEGSIEGLNKVKIECSDLDPEVEDEIFEAYFSSENACDQPEVDFWDSEDKFKKIIEKEYCKNVMEELKLKLIEKDKCWKKREKELLKKKGLADESEETLENEPKQNTEKLEERTKLLDKIEKPNSQVSLIECQRNFESSESTSTSDLVNLKMYKNNEFDNLNVKPKKSEQCTTYQDNVIYHNNSDSLEIPQSYEANEMKSLENDNSDKSSVYAFNKCLLTDLNEARKKIFKSALPVTEVIYASSEDESSED